MRAVTFVNGAVVIADRPDPEPGEGDVLVTVRSAGVNAADLIQLAGHYPAPPGVPADIPGLEFAGTVAAIGAGVSGLGVGQRVAGLTGGGAMAELCAVPAGQLIGIPESLGWSEAGGLVEAAATAHDALITNAALSAGERVAVTGAAGGVGVAAVQIAALRGASVVASVGRAEYRDAVAGLSPGRVTAVAPEELARCGPFDVHLELVGGEAAAAALRGLATGGRMVVIGVGAGSRVELDLGELMRRRARLSGSTLRSRSAAEKAAVIAALTGFLQPHLEAGRYRVPLAATFPLDHAAAAFARFSAGAKFGKVVLTVSA